MKDNYKKDFKKRPFKKRHTRADFYLEGCPEGVKVPDGEPGTLERAVIVPPPFSGSISIFPFPDVQLTAPELGTEE